MADDKIFAKGFYPEIHEKKPDFVVCNVGIDVKQFTQFLETYQKKGRVKIEIKLGRSGRPYADLNQYESTSDDKVECNPVALSDLKDGSPF
jgi:hypothetical protein